MKDLKQALRRQLLEQAAAIPVPERTRYSANACALLRSQSVWGRCRSVLFFAPLRNEIDIWPLLEVALGEGKLVALPRFSEEIGGYGAYQVQDVVRDVGVGHLKIREPVPTCRPVRLNQLDFVFVPGVAFDLQGGRLGRGKGFYDRLLQQVTGMTCGVAFDEQIVPRVPVEPHDVHLDCILTPTRWIEVQAARGFE